MRVYAIVLFFQIPFQRLFSIAAYLIYPNIRIAL